MCFIFCPIISTCHFAKQFQFWASKPNSERASRICVYDVCTYTWYIYVYIYPLRFMKRHFVFRCAFCGVGNKLRVSCKEIRFYFCTQLEGLFCLCFILKPTACKTNLGTLHEHFDDILFMAKFPFKGREGGIVLKIFDKDCPTSTLFSHPSL